MFQFQSQNRTISKMETAAFADIIFLLLIFFLLSSSFILPTEIPVNPPDSSEAVTPEDKPTVVTLTKAGEIYIDDERVPEADLEAALRGRLDGAASRAVAIRADESINVGRLVEVMDLAKEAGAEKLAIATEKKTRSRPR
jgi:biopolymer transport protein ExbD